MNAISIEEFRTHLDKYLADAASGDLVLTQEGKPWLVLRALGADTDADQTEFTQSSEFWQMIRQRRQEQGIPWEQARKELGLELADADGTP
jgi:antitoxin (DNA-binding transcriptional repressor) of toxin-antitoxin stability system